MMFIRSETESMTAIFPFPRFHVRQRRTEHIGLKASYIENLTA